LKCCDEALKISKEAPEIYYRRSQSVAYNTSSNIEDLKNSLNDIETALQISSNEEHYKEHAKLVKQRIAEITDLNKRIIQSIIESKPPKQEQVSAHQILEK
jgi:phosphoenolpyruvate-protein kinase (PTS system EI component)